MRRKNQNFRGEENKKFSPTLLKELFRDYGMYFKNSKGEIVGTANLSELQQLGYSILEVFYREKCQSCLALVDEKTTKRSSFTIVVEKYSVTEFVEFLVHDAWLGYQLDQINEKNLITRTAHFDLKKNIEQLISLTRKENLSVSLSSSRLDFQKEEVPIFFSDLYGKASFNPLKKGWVIEKEGFENNRPGCIYKSNEAYEFAKNHQQYFGHIPIYEPEFFNVPLTYQDLLDEILKELLNQKITASEIFIRQIADKIFNLVTWQSFSLAMDKINLKDELLLFNKSQIKLRKVNTDRSDLPDRKEVSK